MNIKYILVALIALTRASCEGAANKFNDKLLRAAMIGNFDQLKQALINGADVNAIGTYHSTALIIAADMGNEKIVNELLNNKADVNASDKYGRTALMWAADRGHSNVVAQLIQTGADSNTALKKAIDSYDTGAALLLIEHGANTTNLSENQNITLKQWGVFDK